MHRGKESWNEKKKESELKEWSFLQRAHFGFALQNYVLRPHENYANVLILLDAINNGKRGRKLNPFPFVHISHFSIFPLKSLHLFIFHLFIFQSARSYITFIRWRMIRYNDFARTCKGGEIVRSLPVVGNGSSEKKSAGAAKLWSTTTNSDRKTVIPIEIGQPESIFGKVPRYQPRFRLRESHRYQNSNNFLERVIPSSIGEWHRV